MVTPLTMFLFILPAVILLAMAAAALASSMSRFRRTLA
jgi:hypothetical protein